MAPEGGPDRRIGRAIKVLAFVAIIGFGLGMGHGSMAHLSQTAPVAATSWLFALIPVMFSYSGWNAAAYIPEEIRDPQRNVPIALSRTGAPVRLRLLLASTLRMALATAAKELCSGTPLPLIRNIAFRLRWPMTLLATTALVTTASGLTGMLTTLYRSPLSTQVETEC
jgi:APA family basic amino acid/polyamine antiporter